MTDNLQNQQNNELKHILIWVTSDFVFSLKPVVTFEFSSFRSMRVNSDRSSGYCRYIFQLQKNHRDNKILVVQEWIEKNFDQNFNYDNLARKNGMSRRTFERRFKTATGETPLSYQQRLRVETAKHLLESGDRSFDEITYKVGYEDSSTFRKIFYKQTHLRPTEYRKKFQRV